MRLRLLVPIVLLAGCVAEGDLRGLGVSAADPDEPSGPADDEQPAPVSDDDDAGDDDDAADDDDATDPDGDDDDATAPPVGSVDASSVTISGGFVFDSDFGEGQIRFQYWEDYDLQVLACEQIFAVDVAQDLAPDDCAECSARLAIATDVFEDISAEQSDAPCPLDAFAPDDNVGRLLLNDLSGGGDLLSVAFVPDPAAAGTPGFLSDGTFGWDQWAQSLVASGLTPVGIGYVSTVDTYLGAADAGGVIASSAPGEPWKAWLAFYAFGNSEPWSGLYFGPGPAFGFNGVFLFLL
jgi:hypothetical protein